MFLYLTAYKFSSGLKAGEHQPTLPPLKDRPTFPDSNGYPSFLFHFGVFSV